MIKPLKRNTERNSVRSVAFRQLGKHLNPKPRIMCRLEVWPGLSSEDAAGKAKVRKGQSVVSVAASQCYQNNLLVSVETETWLGSVLKQVRCPLRRCGGWPGPWDDWTWGLTSMVNNLCPKKTDWSLFGPKEIPRVHTQHSGWNPAEGSQKAGSIIAAIIYGSTYLSN